MDNHLPPAAPRSSVPPSDALAERHSVPTPPPPSGGWAVRAGRGVDWWKEGWRFFMAAPLIWLLMMLVFFALMIGLGLIPVVGHIASTLLYPVLGGGVMIGTRALD